MTTDTLAYLESRAPLATMALTLLCTNHPDPKGQADRCAELALYSERPEQWHEIERALRGEAENRARREAQLALAVSRGPSADVTVTCPCCELAKVACFIDPGEPRITTGPSDSWYPGAPAGLDSWDSECDCGESSLVDPEKYRKALEERALEGAVC